MRAAVLILPLVLLAACDGKAAGERFRARQAALDPPRLWSVEVVPAQPGVVPVKVCADSRIHAGLTTPAAAAGGTPCRPIGQAVTANGVTVQRCDMNGETWVTSAAVKGDLERDFVSERSAGPVSTDDGGYRQTRRYRLIGDCPTGWNVGDSTNQRGERVKGQSGLLAMIAR
ncbi:MAG: hypothetical protein KF842_04870 [Caulobacter sp.]|nr:hypothetical protein [Caulobacter sp.]